MKPCIIIPARIGSSRLPQKVILPIADKPMISHVYNRAVLANCGDVFVATDSLEVKQIIEAGGGKAIMTPSDLPSGTDRIKHAFTSLKNWQEYTHIINLQGDVPNIDPLLIKDLLLTSIRLNLDITTPVIPILEEHHAQKPNIVKAVINFYDEAKTEGSAIYFSRSPVPHGGKMYEHVGVYIYTKDALLKFTSLPPSNLEIAEKLEQLRAIENGMKIAVKVCNFKPISVDVAEDLQRAEDFFNKKN